MEPNSILNKEYLVPAATEGERGYEHVQGYHLTSKGLYRETVTAICVRNPNIRCGHREYSCTPSEYGRVSVVELSEPHPFHTERKAFNTSQDLSAYLKAKTTSSIRRVIILEGVARNYVDVLGSHFNMDPAFFSNQKRPNSWDGLPDSYCIERTANLPSLNDPERSFMIRYPELRNFSLVRGQTQLEDNHVKDIDGHRTVNIFRRNRELYKGEKNKWGLFHNIGVVSRAASFWSRRYEEGGWDAVLLVDPPPGKMMRIKKSDGLVHGSELKHVHLHGGFQDFIPYPEGLDKSRDFIKKASKGPSRSSMFDDICFYFENHVEELEVLEDLPSIATVFLKKIAATNWVQLADYFDASAHNLEQHFSRNESFDVFRVETMERWWGNLHSWHRRCVQYCEEVDAILVALRIPHNYMLDNFQPMDSREDFTYIYKRLLWTKSRFELLMNSATGLNAIAGNKEATAQNERYSRRAREESKRSLQQARKGSILTFLATVFVPLAVTAGIFSMSGEWAPGGEKFGYYWAITLPLVILMGGLYYLFGLVLKRSKPGDEEDLAG